MAIIVGCLGGSDKLQQAGSFHATEKEVRGVPGERSCISPGRTGGFSSGFGGQHRTFCSRVGLYMASSGHEHLLVSIFCPSALVRRDLLKAGCDAQLSLTKTVSGSYFSFLFCLSLGHPPWWCECELLLSSGADLLVPFKTGSISRVYLQGLVERFLPLDMCQVSPKR